jgi:hypothetical protein
VRIKIDHLIIPKSFHLFRQSCFSESIEHSRYGYRDDTPRFNQWDDELFKVIGICTEIVVGINTYYCIKIVMSIWKLMGRSMD